jgi:hypothetical protein
MLVHEGNQGVVVLFSRQAQPAECAISTTQEVSGSLPQAVEKPTQLIFCEWL